MRRSTLFAPRPRRRPGRLAGPGHLALLGLLALAAPAAASSHSEAPGTAKDRLADDTDLYAYVAADAPAAVTFVGNWVPLLEPNGGPNFYGFDDEAFYYINIDNVGDGLDHIRYQFTFRTTRQTGRTFLYNTGVVTSLDDPDLNMRQTYTITRYDDGVPTVLAADLPVAPNFVGPVSMPDYASLANAAIRTLADGSKVFVGPRDDPFFVDLGAVFDLLTIRKVPGNKGKGVDGVGGFDVLSIVLQVPKTRLTRDGQAPAESNSVIGIYDSVERRATRTLNGDGTASLAGPETQVSRLGHPLVNEVVIPLQDKDRFNATKPTGDGAFLGYVTHPEVPVLLNALYGIAVPPTPRNDLVTVFLTGVPGLNRPASPAAVPNEMLRLNLAIAPATTPHRLGVIAGDLAGFPNGRRLADDVVDIIERVAAGILVPGFDVAPNNQLGDGIDANDRPFLPVFPYVAPPHDPLAHEHHGEQHGAHAGSGRGADERGGSADRLRLAGAHPAPRIALEYAVAAPARVAVRVYDAQGRALRTLVDQDAAAGAFRATWDGRTDGGAVAAPGIYFARFTVNGEGVESRKIVLE